MADLDRGLDLVLGGGGELVVAVESAHVEGRVLGEIFLDVFELLRCYAAPGMCVSRSSSSSSRRRKRPVAPGPGAEATFNIAAEAEIALEDFGLAAVWAFAAGGRARGDFWEGVRVETRKRGGMKNR